MASYILQLLFFFQENNDLKSKNRSVTAQLREIEQALGDRLTVRLHPEPEVKYVDALVKVNSELKEEVESCDVIITGLIHTLLIPLKMGVKVGICS